MTIGQEHRTPGLPPYREGGVRCWGSTGLFVDALSRFFDARIESHRTSGQASTGQSGVRCCPVKVRCSECALAGFEELKFFDPARVGVSNAATSTDSGADANPPLDRERKHRFIGPSSFHDGAENGLNAIEAMPRISRSRHGPCRAATGGLDAN